MRKEELKNLLSSFGEEDYCKNIDLHIHSNESDGKLTPNEIVEQVMAIQMETGLKVTNIVFMGQGEPLMNLDNVLGAMKIFNETFEIIHKHLKKISTRTAYLLRPNDTQTNAKHYLPGGSVYMNL